MRHLALALLMAASGPLPGQPNPPAGRIAIEPSQRFQRIDGFGVNFNGTYFRESQKPMVDMLIDDLGATIFRLDPYGLTNWETLNDNQDPHAMNWEYYNDRYSIPAFEASWAAGRYLNSRGIRPFLTLSGTVPGWMLDDKAPAPRHKICKPEATGGKNHLNPAVYDEFAETVVSLAVYARTRARIDFDYFGPLNETDCYPIEGPRVDPEEMPKVLGAVSNMLREQGLADVKLVAVEQSAANNPYFGPILEDAGLMKQVGVFSLHSYGSVSLAPQVELIRNSNYPQVPVWLTEYGDLNDKDHSAENEWKHFCLLATRRALRALNEGASAALFWDAYDNYHEHDAALTYYGLVRNIDHIYTPKKRYYAAKQLYRFVRPGAQRVGVMTNAAGMLLSAFRDANSIVVVGLKEGGGNHVQVVLPKEKGMPAKWELYQTTRNLDCRKTDVIPVEDGVAEIELADEAIFTLTGVLEARR